MVYFNFYLFTYRSICVFVHSSYLVKFSMKSILWREIKWTKQLLLKHSNFHKKKTPIKLCQVIIFSCYIYKNFVLFNVKVIENGTKFVLHLSIDDDNIVIETLSCFLIMEIYVLLLWISHEFFSLFSSVWNGQI